MTSIDEDELRRLGDHLPAGPARPLAEIEDRARTLRRRRRSAHVAVAVAGTVAGAVVLALSGVVVPGQPWERPAGTTAWDVFAPPPAQAGGLECVDSLTDPGALPPEGRYLPARSLPAPPLTGFAAAVAPCGPDDLPAEGTRPSAVAEQTGSGGPDATPVITLWGPGAGPLEVDDPDRLTDVTVRGVGGRLARPADEAARTAGALVVAWREHGLWWSARSRGLPADKVLAALDGLVLEGGTVTRWPLPEGFTVTVDSAGHAPRPRWRMSAAYGTFEQDGGFSLTVEDRGRNPLAHEGAERVTIAAKDPSVRGTGYLAREGAEEIRLIWMAKDGRRFSLGGRLSRDEALRVAAGLERVGADDPRIAGKVATPRS
ncbi:hypothetical protein ACFYSC_09515 [Streptosporangium sp. NPDC004379]|uniref:hypothetical protein n=1 Tax=Streptosporangium sp. NPDC004379 TaxID=3366189 RepID=UPI0036C5DC04